MSSAIVERILEEVKRLTVDEQRELREALAREPQPAPAYDTHERERAWIEQNRDEYLDQWVALDGDRLLAHGTDAREVYLAARATGVRAPYVERVTPKEEGLLGGLAVTHRLSFAVAHDYSADAAIRLPVTLRSGGDEVRADAFVDTGATYCVFRREVAASLGIDVESGAPVRVGTVTGGFDAYGHALNLETLGYSFEVTVYFAAHEGLPRNVLGRRGWLDHVRLGLVDHDGKLYLSGYEDEG